ncbi:cytochrome P450 [Whalleya microplaca]|nr:cytochrome P450 [Whalleya microplaca]
MASKTQQQSMESLPRQAAQRYTFAMTSVAVLSVTLILDVLYFRPCAPSTQQKALGAVLILLAVYTQAWLREEHLYYAKMAQHGCAPIPTYPNDPLGIRYFLHTVRQIKSHTLLQQRRVQFDTFGRTFKHRAFPRPFDVVLSDEPENIKAVLSTRFDDWVIPSSRIRAFLPVLGRHSIFTVNGPEWQHHRAIMRPAFVRDQISDLRCFDRHVAKLIAHIPRDGRSFDLQAMFSLLTTDTISDFMFGQSTDILGNAPEDGLRFGRYFEVAMQKIADRGRLGRLTTLLPDPELDECTTFMHGFVARYIDEVKQQNLEQALNDESRRYSFLGELLKSGEPDEVIRDHLMSIFTAGRDTTTSVLSYLFFELSRRPDIVTTIQEEIRDLGEADPTWEHLRNMKYLNWAIKEALRLNPPVAINARESIRDTILPTGGGPDGKSPVFIPKGSHFRYVPWIMQRREGFYGSDAEEFRPERWESLRPTYEYVPFNAGPRICIGQQFALTQMAFITFRLLQAFKKIERRDEKPPIQKLGINLSMLYGCWVSMTPA